MQPKGFLAIPVCATGVLFALTSSVTGAGFEKKDVHLGSPIVDSTVQVPLNSPSAVIDQSVAVVTTPITSDGSPLSVLSSILSVLSTGGDATVTALSAPILSSLPLPRPEVPSTTIVNTTTTPGATPASSASASASGSGSGSPVTPSASHTGGSWQLRPQELQWLPAAGLLALLGL